MIPPAPSGQGRPPTMRSHFRTRFAALALGLTTLTSAAPVGAAGGFSDVEADRWFTTPISWMAAEGITTGTEPGCFSPHAAVSRGQIVTFLYRLASTEGDLPVTNGHPFDDVVRAYQHEPVGWAYDAGITTGTSATTFAQLEAPRPTSPPRHRSSPTIAFSGTETFSSASASPPMRLRVRRRTWPTWVGSTWRVSPMRRIPSATPSLTRSPTSSAQAACHPTATPR
ncbi:MAG: S-layer homology domain-containing protein [Actinobacteria bacterium]|nr:S-layer homology domain-containing protein [Actinomycetota bacterium]